MMQSFREWLADRDAVFRLIVKDGAYTVEIDKYGQRYRVRIPRHYRPIDYLQPMMQAGSFLDHWLATREKE